jgi:hypothetical protein
MTERLDEEFDFLQQFVKRFALAWGWHAVSLLLKDVLGVAEIRNTALSLGERVVHSLRGFPSADGNDRRPS